MKTYKKIIVPESTREVLVETKCDLCDKTTKTEWKVNIFDAVEVAVKLRTGKNFPEGGSGEETVIDICPACFEGKLIPWVESVRGGAPTTKSWEW